METGPLSPAPAGGGSRAGRRALALAAVLATGLAPAAGAAPLRTPSPATGVYRAFALSTRLTHGEERSDDRSELTDAGGAIEVRYTPATHWSLGVVVPWVERTARAPLQGAARREGIGDVRLGGRFRFFRELGSWRDRQAALGFGVELPTGEVRLAGTEGLAVALARGVQTGSGSTDLFADLSYQQARGRFVQAASLGYRRNGEGDGYRFGDEARLDLDVEAIVLPLPRHYTVPGREVFVLLEMAVVHRGADELQGTRVRGTERTEVLLAPGLEYVATERLALGASVAFPVLSRVEDAGMATRRHVLVEARYAF